MLSRRTEGFSERIKVARVLIKLLQRWGVRCWELQEHLAAPAQTDASVEGLHGARLHHVLAAPHRYSRAAWRTGYCAIVTGCGRVHDQHAPDPSAGYLPLHQALMELATTWEASTPTSCPEAAADLAALLRKHAALHREVAPALCAACRPAFLAHLEIP